MVVLRRKWVASVGSYFLRAAGAFIDSRDWYLFGRAELGRPVCRYSVGEVRFALSLYQATWGVLSDCVQTL